MKTTLSFFSILIFLFTLTGIKAQTTFLSVIADSSLHLTSEEQIEMAKLESEGYGSDVWHVAVADLASFQVNGYLELSLPDLPFIPSVRAKHVESFENGTTNHNYYWYGEIELDTLAEPVDTICAEGFVTLKSKDEKISGCIKIADNTYELYSLRPNHSVLVKRIYPNNEFICANELDLSTSSIPPPNVEAAEARNGNNCPVRVLALFTQGASDDVMNIEEKIELTIDQTNQAFRNSGIQPSEVELILEDIQQIDFDETSDIEDDLNNIISDNTIQELRENANADIVVVFTDEIYPGVRGAAGTLTLEDEKAFCITISSPKAVDDKI